VVWKNFFPFLAIGWKGGGGEKKVCNASPPLGFLFFFKAEDVYLNNIQFTSFFIWTSVCVRVCVCVCIYFDPLLFGDFFCVRVYYPHRDTHTYTRRSFFARVRASVFHSVRNRLERCRGGS
jgi:hypothetical protein